MPSSEILGLMILVAGQPSQLTMLLKLNSAQPSGFKTVATFSCHGKFLPPFSANCAQMLHPLTDLLKGGAKTLVKTASAQDAFQGAKCLLAAVVPLPAPTTELSLATDAPDTRRVMQQIFGDQW
jgi:hypothetical protein